MGPRVQFGAEVDGRRKGRTTNDVGVYPEEYQLPGSVGRHQRRFHAARLNLSGSADFRALPETGWQTALEGRVFGLGLDLLQSGFEVPLLDRDLLERRLVQVRKLRRGLPDREHRRLVAYGGEFRARVLVCPPRDIVEVDFLPERLPAGVDPEGRPARREGRRRDVDVPVEAPRTEPRGGHQVPAGRRPDDPGVGP